MRMCFPKGLEMWNTPLCIMYVQKDKGVFINKQNSLCKTLFMRSTQFRLFDLINFCDNCVHFFIYDTPAVN